jgi:hypothetical protein
MNRRVFSLVALLCVGLLLTGCAGRFDRAWREAGTRSPESPLAGRWDGKWRSEKHKGSGGRLRGVMIPQGKDAYRAEFKANWLVFSSTYTVNFQTETRRGEVHFQGEHDLGPLFGGVYNFIGRATPDRFHASYDSSYDRGIFEMSRPGSLRN